MTVTPNQVGYKLVKLQDNSVVDQWGGTWGICPSPPNPLILPNGDHICVPEIDVEYSGYKLVVWEMDQPPEPIPPTLANLQAQLAILTQQINSLANTTPKKS